MTVTRVVVCVSTYANVTLTQTRNKPITDVSDPVQGFRLIDKRHRDTDTALFVTSLIDNW